MKIEAMKPNTLANTPAPIPGPIYACADSGNKKRLISSSNLVSITFLLRCIFKYDIPKFSGDQTAPA